uniref:Putative chemosensory protein n=1 Tax=Sesamia inferens TaxID=492764 RepID=U5PZS0_SESIF|nr:putative chemosensory protein [Sesamia inferens]
MKLVCIVLLLTVVAVQAQYSTENDDLNIDALVANEESFKSFVGCFLDRVTCDAVPADFKKDIPDAVKTSCTKCTDAQKHIFHKFLLGLKEKLPSDYEAFKNKYDPGSEYFTALEAAVANS